MGIQRADVLFPVNSTVVDSAAGIDIRLLDSAQAGATDSDQSVRFTHAQDGQERTFDPDNALVTTVADPLSFQGEGWALRLTEDHTPTDDTNCNSVLTAQALSVTVRCLLNMNGGTNAGGLTTITFRASLWRYNTSSNTGTLIGSASQPTSWDTSVLGGENNTRKNTQISPISVARTEFLANEVLLLQLGCEGTTLPDATLGTTNFDVTLDVDDPGTFLDFAAGEGIRIWCQLTNNVVGEGLVPVPTKAITQPRTATGEGLVSSTKATIVSKTFNLIGEGLVSRTLAVAEDFDLIGEGISSMTRVVGASVTVTVLGEGLVTRALDVGIPRTVIGEGLVSFTKAVIVTKIFDLIGEGLVSMDKNTQAQRTFDLVGEGVVTRTLAVAIPRDVVGDGLVSFTKVVIAFKSFTVLGEGVVSRVLAITEDFDLIGEGLVTEVHPVSAFRTFNLVGIGEILTTGPNGSTICLPIDELPAGDTIVVTKKALFVFDD